MVNEKLQITVAVCTFDREKHIHDLCSHLIEKHRDVAGWELLVVDNSPNDRIWSKLKNSFAYWDRFRAVRSTPPGLSIARNNALEHAKGDYIVYIDDDCWPRDTWLPALLQEVVETDAIVLGGPIEPIWPNRQPDWTKNKHEACLTILDHGPIDKVLNDGEYLYGTNICFKLNALKKIGGFDTSLGRSGKVKLLSDEEIVIQDELAGLGARKYLANAGVRHHVHTDRIRQSFFRSRMSWQSITDLDKHADPETELTNAIKAARRLNVQSISGLFVQRPREEMDLALDLTTSLQKALLSQHLLDDETVSRLIVDEQVTKTRHHDIPPDDIESNYKLLTSLGDIAAVKNVFVDWHSGHKYLYQGLSQGIDSTLVTFGSHPFHHFDEKVQTLLFANEPKNIFFITLDGFLYGQTEWLDALMADNPHHNYFGVLHRIYDWIDSAQVSQAMSKFNTIFTLSDLSLPDADNVVIQPLPLLSKYESFFARLAKNDSLDLFDHRSRDDDQIYLGLIGELRPEKGLQFLEEAIEKASDDISGISLVLAGKRSVPIDSLKEAANKRSIDVIDFTLGGEGSDYELLTDYDFAMAIAMCDIGLVLNMGDQEKANSATLSNFISAGQKVISRSPTYCGRLVEKFDLGWTVGSPQELGTLMAFIKRNDLRKDGGYFDFQKQIQVEQVSKIIKSKLV